MVKYQKSLIALLLPLSLGLAACLLVIGVNAINPTVLNLAQGVDPFKDYVGWIFYRNSPWSFPIGLNPSYGLDFSNSIVFSDSIPLMAFFFKAIRFVLPETFQYLGIWTLLCFILQAYFARLLLSLMQGLQQGNLQNHLLQLFACALFVFSPPMLWRVNQHTALIAHFMILAGFYLIFSPGRTDKSWNKAFWWALLLSSALLTHFSLFVMVSALWAANLLDQIRDAKTERLTSIKNAFYQLICIGALITVLMWQAGYFSVSSSSGSLGGYGFFRMNLLSPFDPKGWSYVLRTLPLPSDYGEGYMYLGLGFLFLWPFALFKLVSTKQARGLISSQILRHVFLTITLICLACFAITNHIAIGRKEFGFAISDSVYALASIFRASGRMFWPMFYALNLSCIYLLIKTYSKRNALILLGLASLLQVVDTSAGWRTLHQYISDPKINIPHTLSLGNPFWVEASKHYEQVLLVPPQDKATGWDQIALYASKYHLATNAVFFARMDSGKLISAQESFLNSLNSSSWRQNSLYVLQPDVVIPAYFHSDPNKDLLVGFDGFAVLAPNWKQCEKCPIITENLRNELDDLIKQVTNRSIGFGKGEIGTRFLIGVGGSWAWPESWGVWSNGNEAKLILPIPQGNAGSLKHIQLRLRAFVSALHPQQEVEVFVDRMPPQNIMLSNAEENTWMIDLPSQLGNKKYVELQFHLKNPASPKDVGGVPGDDRRLGIGLISAQFRQ